MRSSREKRLQLSAADGSALVESETAGVEAQSPADVGAPGTDPASDGAAVERRSFWHRHRRAILEWVAVALSALAVVLLLRAFVVQAFFVPSGSMQPTLQIGDRILVEKLGFSPSRVHVGDIVVFRRPPGDTVDPGIADLVKRVVGLPGQRISSKGQTIYINGHKLAEPWLPPGPVLGSEQIHAQTIPQGDFFVMGDNRAASYDSRYFGPISGKLILGKVFVIFWRNDHPYFHWF